MAGKRTLGFSLTALRKKFRGGMTVRNYRDNEVVFSQGDTADAVFYVQSGVNQQTKEVSNVLIRRGQEWHALDRMILNARHIVFVEPVGKDSRVAKLIEELRSKP